MRIDNRDDTRNIDNTGYLGNTIDIDNIYISLILASLTENKTTNLLSQQEHSMHQVLTVWTFVRTFKAVMEYVKLMTHNNSGPNTMKNSNMRATIKDHNPDDTRNTVTPGHLGNTIDIDDI